MKYKIGDRVVVKSGNIEYIFPVAGKTGTIIGVMDWYHHPYRVDFGNGLTIWCEVRDYAPVEQKIVITANGKVVTARLYEGNKTVKESTAKCCPEDIFDFNVGAEIAFNRLVGKPCGEEAPKPKYYSGKVVCVKSDDRDFTVGKVYEIQDGKFIDNDGDTRPYHDKYVCTLDDLINDCYFSKFWNYNFIPFVEG